MDLVHMDIKPGNIFISIEPRFNSVNNESADDGFEENANSSTLDTECASSETITYKIGDLGHVTSILVPEVNEGDCRYLSYEILQDNYKNLSKADIFSLGNTFSQDKFYLFNLIKQINTFVLKSKKAVTPSLRKSVN